MSEGQADHARAILRRHQHFIQIVARQGVFHVSVEGGAFVVRHRDGLRTNGGVEPVVGHPLTLDNHDVRTFVDQGVHLREFHRTARSFGLVASFVHRIPVVAVVRHRQTRNREHFVNGTKVTTCKFRPLDGDVFRAILKHRSLSVVHAPRLRQRRGRVGFDVEGTVGDLNKLVATESVEEDGVLHVGNHVAGETSNRLSVVNTFPTEPTAEAVVAVVVVATCAKLETLVHRNWHVAQEERFTSVALVQTSQTRQRVDHVEDVEDSGVHVALPACQQPMSRAFGQPLVGVLAIHKVQVHFVHDGGVHVVVNHTRQTSGSIGKHCQGERVLLVFDEVIAQAVCLRAQTVDADRSVGARALGSHHVIGRVALHDFVEGIVE